MVTLYIDVQMKSVKVLCELKLRPGNLCPYSFGQQRTRAAPKHASPSQMQLSEGKKDRSDRCFHAFRILALELITGTERKRKMGTIAPSSRLQKVPSDTPYPMFPHFLLHAVFFIRVVAKCCICPTLKH